MALILAQLESIKATPAILATQCPCMKQAKTQSEWLQLDTALLQESV
jgi:hypothetical protein